MSGLRRTACRSGFSPIAAEVLESRALLSSAAVAVHNATHHAAIHQATPATDLTPQAGFHGTVNALVSFVGSPPGLIPGQFSISKINVVLGAKVTAHFAFSINSGGNKLSLKASFAGTVASFGAVPGGTLIALTPTGGSIVVTSKHAGSPTVKLTAIPNGSPVFVTVNGANSFLGLGATDVFKAGTPGGLAGLPIAIVITA